MNDIQLPEDVREATGIPCPYCREPLTGRSGPQEVYRVAVGCRGGQACECYATLIPATHMLVQCLACKAKFTVPESRTSEGYA